MVAIVMLNFVLWIAIGVGAYMYGYRRGRQDGVADTNAKYKDSIRPDQHGITILRTVHNFDAVKLYVCPIINSCISQHQVWILCI